MQTTDSTLSIFKYSQVSGDPVPFLNDFSFTESDTIAERWRVSLEITKAADGMLQMKIPSFVPAKNLLAPAGTVLVKCHIATVGVI